MNPSPSKYESPPITTRPGLPPRSQIHHYDDTTEMFGIFIVFNLEIDNIWRLHRLFLSNWANFNSFEMDKY